MHARISLDYVGQSTAYTSSAVANSVSGIVRPSDLMLQMLTVHVGNSRAPYPGE
jgi:hypothetical protein